MKTTLTVLLILGLYGLSSGFIKQHFFVKERMTWNSASKHCKTHFYDLSTFTNVNEEQQFLEDAAYQPSDAWVGLNKVSGVWQWSGGKSTQAETEHLWTGLRYQAGHWFWVNGDDLDYKDWYQNQQPQCPARNLRCGALDKKTQNWIHRDCEEKLNFLCSAQAVPQVVPQTTVDSTPPAHLTSPSPKKTVS
ncbi:hypothetical protein Q8A67_007158 [Cirrhinus molitorella]|uniref:C-type lectin domain-containing protein n=1 Tax=Cirrhinus molitorella TaxID=172907 RepID=A0AA88Q303_9TELE|nr:hypothetical protein Q8A67_007158 [Cirrhinus molitorella]